MPSTQAASPLRASSPTAYASHPHPDILSAALLNTGKPRPKPAAQAAAASAGGAGIETPQPPPPPPTSPVSWKPRSGRD